MNDVTASPVITRQALADDLAAHTSLSKTGAALAVAILIERLAARLQTGATVHLKGLGRFQVVATPERPGRNPKTGEPCVIPAGRRVKFSPSKALRGREAAG